MIDLRRDTCSRPTADIRAAMVEVGDDVYGDDPTVKALGTRPPNCSGKGRVYICRARGRDWEQRQYFTLF